MCAVCGNIEPALLCDNCLSNIGKIGDNICRYCGRPLCVDETGSGVCNFCRMENFNFYRHRSFAVYDGGIREIIKKYKYGRIYALKEIISIFMAESYFRNYRDEKIEYLETVPGKHMEMVCESLSGLIKIPFIGNIIRVKKILKQQGLDFIQRKNNIRGAFKIRDCLKYYGRNILVVDDVWTTGSTMMEISDILRNAGANKIYLLTLARGIR